MTGLFFAGTTKALAGLMLLVNLIYETNQLYVITRPDR